MILDRNGCRESLSMAGELVGDPVYAVVNVDQGSLKLHEA